MQITELSYSSFSEYALFCPQKYYYRKIAHLEPEFVSAELVMGSGIHTALECHFRAKLAGKTMSLDELMVPFANAFDNDKIRYNGQNREEMTDEAYELLKLAVQAPVGKILGVEVPVEIPISEGFKIIGFIDLLTEENGRKVIFDWKTCKRRPNPDDVEGNLQFTTYSLAYPDAQFRLVALLKQKKACMETYSTERTNEHRRRAVKTFIAAKKAIEANQWFPREGWWCDNCPYSKQCHLDF